MINIRRFRFLNPEWFREPQSVLELTLRVPYFLRHGFSLFKYRILLRLLLLLFVSWYLTDLLLISIVLVFPIFLLSELFLLKKDYYKNFLPRHLSNIETIKDYHKVRYGLSDEDLASTIESSIDISSWGAVRIAYTGLASWGWEILFKSIYPVIVRSSIPYQNLLIGFNNKVVETDQKLWEVSQEKNKEKQYRKLDKYLDEYGSRVEDADLSFQTLREKPDVVNNMIELYSKIPSPLSAVNEAKKTREISEREILSELRIPRSWFKFLLKTVQQNVMLREDRRFYEFIGDYYIREMVLELAKRLDISNKEIFNQTWKDIKREAN